MTFPRYRAMTAQWRYLPPAALQLARIASAIGIKPAPESPPSSPSDFIEAAQSSGMPLFDTLPDDPMLALLDQVERELQQQPAKT